MSAASAALARNWLYLGRAASQGAAFTFFNTKRSEVSLVCANVALPESLAGSEWVQL